MTKIVTLTAVMFFYISTASSNWEDQLEKYKKLMNDDTYSLILAQHRAFKRGCLPRIADEKLEKIQINESKEEYLDIREQNHPRIKMLPDPPSPFVTPGYNSGLPEASKVRMTLYKKLEKLIYELDKIAPEFDFKHGQVNIKIFEGLRSLKTQTQLFSNEVEKVKKENPCFTHEQSISEASKWISPVQNHVLAHSTGRAVDIRLFDAMNEEFLDMGTFCVIWGKDPKASTFSNDINSVQVKNRLFLLIAAGNAGFVNYPHEFWHFSADDHYAAYWLNPQL